MTSKKGSNGPPNKDDGRTCTILPATIALTVGTAPAKKTDTTAEALRKLNIREMLEGVVRYDAWQYTIMLPDLYNRGP